MSLLHIVIGFNSAGPSAEPYPVYVGRSGHAAQQAQLASPAVRFEVIKNAVGLRKNNPHAEANAVRLRAEDAALTDSTAKAMQVEREHQETRARHISALEAGRQSDAAQLAALRVELETAKTKADAQARTIAELTAEIQRAKEPAPESAAAETSKKSRVK